jgi:hypothetical protein
MIFPTLNTSSQLFTRDNNGKLKLNKDRMKRLEEYNLIKNMIFNVSNDKLEINLVLLQNLILELFMKHSIYSINEDLGLAYDSRLIAEITKDCIYEFVFCNSNQVMKSLQDEEVEFKQA